MKFKKTHTTRLGWHISFDVPITAGNFWQACQIAIGLAQQQCTAQSTCEINFVAQGIPVQVVESDSAETQFELWQRRADHAIEIDEGALESAREVAVDAQFANYHFGDGVKVEDSGGWERVSSGNEWTRPVFVRVDQGVTSDAPSEKLVFTVRFALHRVDVVEAYAIDRKGCIWGAASPRATEPPPQALNALDRALQALQLASQCGGERDLTNYAIARDDLALLRTALDSLDLKVRAAGQTGDDYIAVMAMLGLTRTTPAKASEVPGNVVLVPTLPDLILAMKQDVLNLMKVGRIPTETNTFARLHDFCEANGLGGLLDAELFHAMIAKFGGRVENQELPRGMLYLIDSAQDGVNAWLVHRWPSEVSINTAEVFADAGGELGQAWRDLAAAENELAAKLQPYPKGAAVVVDDEAWFLEVQPQGLALCHGTIAGNVVSDVTTRHDINLEWVDLDEEEVSYSATRVLDAAARFDLRPLSGFSLMGGNLT